MAEFMTVCSGGSRNKKLFAYTMASKKAVNLGQNQVGL